MVLIIRFVVAIVALQLVSVCWLTGIDASARGDEFAAPLPDGVQAVWDVEKAFRETTSTRERICINGLWRWQPAGASQGERPKATGVTSRFPAAGPASPTTCRRTVRRSSHIRAGGTSDSSQLAAAWYEREITVPADWDGRRIAVSVEYLNSLAVVFVDGKRAGELRFPGGELDLTSLCRPGRHTD